MLVRLGLEVRDHEEARVYGLPRELPHGPAKQVVEMPPRRSESAPSR